MERKLRLPVVVFLALNWFCPSVFSQNDIIEKGKDVINKLFDKIGLPEEKKPVIEDISPKSGSFGTKITIIGRNFNSAQMPITSFSPVYFGEPGQLIGGQYVKIITPRTDTELVVEAPEGKGTVAITVGQSNEFPFAYLPPVIEKINPSIGRIGKNAFLSTTITLTGKNFGFHKPVSPAVGHYLLFGHSLIKGKGDLLEWTDDKIVFRTPADGGTGLSLPLGLSEAVAIGGPVLGIDPLITNVVEGIDKATTYALQLAVDRALKQGERKVKIIVKTLAGESAKAFTYQIEKPNEKALEVIKETTKRKFSVDLLPRKHKKRELDDKLVDTFKITGADWSEIKIIIGGGQDAKRLVPSRELYPTLPSPARLSRLSYFKKLEEIKNLKIKDIVDKDLIFIKEENMIFGYWYSLNTVWDRETGGKSVWNLIFCGPLGPWTQEEFKYVKEFFEKE